MGVKGLYSLLKENQIFEYIPFRDSRLVVDGNNLVHHLYFTSNLDQNHGGQYLAFQAQVRTFFTNLDVCGVEPYVLMDGSSGDTTLSDMNVPQVKCFGEADCQVAALAREWRCPVLSKDSDFYIFDLPEGLLLLDNFRWDAVKVDDGGSYIPCQRYTTTLFCNFFHINPNLLPVFASLARNDSVFLPEDGREMPWPANLVGLLRWLQGFQMTEERPNSSNEHRARKE
ncbi:hypothetical protein CRUP_020471 [Coryphaenoides rupestris]|nr:hypothetical protein CRUP_020471 [Coryphaenoides rupestris]